MPILPSAASRRPVFEVNRSAFRQVLNVMTGVFVNSAIKTRERDHETLIQNKQKFKELVSRTSNGHLMPFSSSRRLRMA